MLGKTLAEGLEKAASDFFQEQMIFVDGGITASIMKGESIAILKT